MKRISQVINVELGGVVLLVLVLGRLAAAQEGLVGYWPFDGSGADLSGGGRDTVLAGGVGFAPGLFGQALDMHNNGSQFAARPIDDAIYDFGVNDFTVQVWVNFNNTSREQTLIEKFSSAAGPGWTLTKLDGNALHFFASPAIVLTSASLSISSRMWHHILVRRQDTTFQIFYDGSEVVQGSSTGAISDAGMPLLVGQNDGIDPLTKEMTMQIGTLSTAIPAGAFEQDDGTFKFERTIDGIELEMQIIPPNGNTFALKAAGEGAELSKVGNPVPVQLTIGDDTSTATV